MFLGAELTPTTPLKRIVSYRIVYNVFTGVAFLSAPTAGARRRHNYVARSPTRTISTQGELEGAKEIVKLLL